MKIPFLKQYPWLGTSLEWLLKIIIFGLLTWAIYHQVYSSKNLAAIKVGFFESIRTHQLLLALVLLLMIINWGLETIKWRMLVKKVEVLKPATAFMAVMSGITFTMFTPNRMGEYGGRFLFLKEPLRPAAFQATILGSIAQILATLLFGIIGMVFYFTGENGHALPHNIFGLLWLLLGVPLLVIIYFNADAILSQLPEKVTAKWKNKLPWVHFTNSELGIALLLSAGRYLVYAFQYLLLLQIFTYGNAITVHNASGVSLIFLVQTIVPSIALFDLPIRGNAALAILGDSTDGPGLIGASFMLWFINLLIPSIIGFLIILTRRIVNRKDEA